MNPTRIENLNPIIVNYFANLFTSEIEETDPGFLDQVTPRVTNEMNAKLLAPFVEKDVKQTVFSIGDLKAPGPDGLHVLFYKKFWHLVGNDVTSKS